MMFQARLEISELAYLIHTFSGVQVIGINNDHLFPANAEQTEELLERGLTALKTHGWLAPDDHGFNMSNHLMLTAAVIAQPEQVVIFSKRVGETGKQVVTYYQTQDIIVEQLFTADEDYLLTQLLNSGEMIERLDQAMQLPEKAIWESPLTVDAPFLEQLQRGEVNSWKQSLPIEADAVMQAQLQQALQGIDVIASLDIAHLDLDGRPSASAQILILQAKNGAMWMLTAGSEQTSFLLCPLDKNQFGLAIQHHLTASTG